MIPHLTERDCILVSGATGYVGANVAASLSREGIRVIALARPSSDLGLLASHSPETTIALTDGSIESLRAIIVNHKPAQVVNLAAHFISEHAPSDIPILLKSNFEFPLSLLEASVAEGVRGFVSAGTFWEEWSTDNKSPVNLYAALKCSFKDILKFYVDAFSLNAIHLRLPDVYGPTDPRKKLFYWLRNAASSTKPLEMTSGLQTMNLVHVSDIGTAFLRAWRMSATSPESGFLEYGLFHDSSFTLREIVTTYESVVKRSVPILWGHRAHRQREVMLPMVMGNLPGWSPRFDLVRGVEQMEMSPGGLLYENMSR